MKIIDIKKRIRETSLLLILGSVSTSHIFASSLNIPDPFDDTPSNNGTSGVNNSPSPAIPPARNIGSGQQPNPQDLDKYAFPKDYTGPQSRPGPHPVVPTTAKVGDIQSLMDQLSSQLKIVLLTGGSTTAKFEIKRQSLIRLIQVLDPEFSAESILNSKVTSNANIEPATFGVSSATGTGPWFTQQFVTGVGSRKTLDSAPADNYVFGSVVELQVPQPDTFYAYLLKKNITTIIDYAIKNRYVALWETNTDDDNAMHNPNFINILDDLNFNIHDYKYQLQAIKVDHMEVEEYYRNYQSYLVRFAELNPPPQPRTFSWNDQFPEPLPE